MACVTAIAALSVCGRAAPSGASTVAPDWASTSTPAAVLTNGGGVDDGNNFGYSAALSADGTTAVVGAVGAAVYVFHGTGGTWTSTAVPTATLTHTGVSPGRLRFVRGHLRLDGDHGPGLGRR